MKSTILAAFTAVTTTLAVAGSAAAFTIQRADEHFQGLINSGVFNDYIHTEYQALDPSFVSSRQLDLSKLTLDFNHEVKVHFLSEGAWYRNQLGVSATGATTISDTILFDDIVCLTSSCSTHIGYRNSGNDPTANALQAGDFVSLGTVNGGTTLDFFLNSDGYGRSNPTRLYVDSSRNRNGFQQVMAYEQSGYLVLAFEDIVGGGDRDYNDVVFALDIGKKNMNAIRGVQVPEPTMVLGLLAVGAAFSLVSRKGEQKS
ncbi:MULTISPECIES: DUF4114 domain-containing protein [Limnospira]|nr:DUF4114 domain-containing protein [Limnospira sp. PMC 894.15]MDC0839451.1 DUF4114 domain-containing protein [Limnoraphis robusta]MDT9190832.1 DUF4114 domain-containing protein [Limnospira sp. PMC 894.15]QJB24656.1 DUF4114 domain-containing protein [Limnospira fusiformis SAG 85.79]